MADPHLNTTRFRPGPKQGVEIHIFLNGLCKSIDLFQAHIDFRFGFLLFAAVQLEPIKKLPLGGR